MAGKINWTNFLVQILELEWGSSSIWDVDGKLLSIYLKIGNKQSAVERKKQSTVQQAADR